jgi:hypothetical protein
MISHLFPELNVHPKPILLFLDFFAVFFLLVALPSIVLSVCYRSIHIWQHYMPKIQLLLKLTKMWIQSLFYRLKKTHSSSMTQSCTEPLTQSDLSELSSLAPRTFPKTSASPKKPLRGKNGRFIRGTRG